MATLPRSVRLPAPVHRLGEPLINPIGDVELLVDRQTHRFLRPPNLVVPERRTV